MARIGQGRSGIMNRAGANDDEQAIVFAMHDALDIFARLGNQLFDRRAGNGEKANQMFWRREHGDVLDAFVVGLAGLVDLARIPGFALRFGFIGHRETP